MEIYYYFAIALCSGLVIFGLFKRRVRKKALRYLLGQWRTAVPFWIWFAVLLLACGLSGAFGNNELLDSTGWGKCGHVVWSVAAVTSTWVYGTLFYSFTVLRVLDERGRPTKEKWATLSLILLPLFIACVLAMLPGLSILVGYSFPGYDLGDIWGTLHNSFFAHLTLTANVVIPLLFFVVDCRVLKTQGDTEEEHVAESDYVDNPFGFYATMADLPAICGLLVIGLVYLALRSSGFNSELPAETFYAGASAFQFVTFNLSFAFVGIYLTDV